MDDRLQNIEQALRYLENVKCAVENLQGTLEAPDGSIDVVNTSFLYETAPMYVTDQPSFINGACLVSIINSLVSLSEYKLVSF